MAKTISLNDSRPKALVFLESLVQICLVSVIGLFVARYFFFSSTTESKSMEPTIVPDSVIFTNRLAYIIDPPERFDAITFQRSEGNPEEGDILVRRIVGLPGETVRIDKGVVYIDGNMLPLGNYISEITSDGIAEEPIRLGDNEYFVLGDTPANSEDSRSITIGKVSRVRIIGRAWMAAQSLTEFQFIR